MRKLMLGLLLVACLAVWGQMAVSQETYIPEGGGPSTSEVVDTVEEIEEEAATATSKTITIPSGTYLASDNNGTGVCTGGSTNGDGGNGEVEALVAVFAKTPPKLVPERGVEPPTY